MTATDLQLDAHAKKAIGIAQAIAKEHVHGNFGPAHLLKALLHKDVALEPVLWQKDHDVYYIAEWADVRIESYKKAPAPKENVSADDAVLSILDEADNTRLQLNEEQVTPLHLLIAIVTPGVGFTHDQLKSLSITRDALLTERSEDEELKEILGGANNGQAQPGKGGTTNALLKFCQDKTLAARQEKLDPIIGREQETRMMAEILSRRSKPNVMIVGEPGVGKSALVDGFAIAVEKKQVPAFLQDARIFELDNGALIAGASYKGEIEERLKSIIKEIKAFDKAILFIDEIHTLLDKHGAAGSAANLLKPELARGAITVIGATTLEEYRKHIEKDEAFARRFEVLQVNEPDAETAFRMMKMIIPYYEKHHRIEAGDDILKETVRFAKRYIKDKKLPDAAIDLADRSMASLRLAIDTGEQVLNNAKAEFDTLKSENPLSLESLQWHYQTLSKTLSPVLWSDVTQDDDPLKEASPEILIQRIEDIYNTLLPLVPVSRTGLLKHDVAAIIANKTGIPLGKLQSQEKERLLNMPAILSERVVGQDAAIHAISEAILESRSGLSKPGQPIGSFFFLGPTGTGKTELAKALAEFMFQDEKFMIRFDMSEFKEEHSAALLYGAPPGYVGYEEGGLLVNKIRQQPYAVVLFDEIEKAHASVFDIFLQIMDEGKLHDKLGKEGDFSNAVVIFTSNIGSKFVTQSFNEGKVPTHNDLMDVMANHFRPEFLGRLTEIVPFGPMNMDMVSNVFRMQMKGLYALLDKQGITLEISKDAATHVAKKGFTPEYGARPLGGVIRGLIRRPLSRKIISGELQHGDKIKLDVDKSDELIWIPEKKPLNAEQKKTKAKAEDAV